MGRFVVLDSIDHNFFRTASTEESYRIFAPPAAGAAAPARLFNPIILEALRAWLNEMAAMPERVRDSS
jgi:hypothetical protein